MKYHTIDGDINEENTQALLDFINQNEGHDMQIGISSSGGFFDYARFVTDVLNQNKDSIVLVAVGNVYGRRTRHYWNAKTQIKQFYDG